MGSDFGAPYSGIQYFGGCWDFGHDDFGKRDAMAVLAEAVRQCADRDQRERQEVRDALAYLERHAGCMARVNAFRRALNVVPPLDRHVAALAAFRALAASLARP